VAPSGPGAQRPEDLLRKATWRCTGPRPTARVRLLEVEALARWEMPGRGSVPPAAFIPVAEETGMIVKLGEWILERACRDVARWS
jgi:EAL domain-containing protein (putative c-di-GMP-specific phosphodiesterase class I)